MDGLRLSALALHAVADRDRAWLLSRLPDAQRGPLAELLTELRRTGIPADPGLITQLVREREAMNEGARGGQPSPGLLQAAAEDVWKQLRGEPDAVAARILRRNRWPWLDDLMALCGPGRARNIEALIRTWIAPRRWNRRWCKSWRRACRRGRRRRAAGRPSNGSSSVAAGARDENGAHPASSADRAGIPLGRLDASSAAPGGVHAGSGSCAPGRSADG
ncbi:hypothetical protein WJ968_20225 [Achromobacter xylosoxidans]